MFNQITIVGSLGRDPEARQTQGGSTIVTLSVATNHSRKVGEDFEKQTIWHRVKVFGKSGEACLRYLKKGSKVMVTGRQENGSYEKNGGRVNTSEIIAAHGPQGVLFLSPKSDAPGGGGGGQGQDRNPFKQGNGNGGAPGGAPAPYDPNDFGPAPGQDDLPF